MHDARLGSDGVVYHLNDIAVISLLKPGYVVGANLLVLERRDDNAREIPDVKRLTDEFSIAWNRENRYAIHEAAQPAQMFTIKPAEHQRWAQYHMWDVADGVYEPLWVVLERV